MPRMEKHKKAKRPWYDVPLNSEQKSEAQKIFKHALFHHWELRPQHLGIWVIARYRFRIFVTFTEDGSFTEAVLTINGREDEPDKRLSKKQLVKLLKLGGRLYYPD